MAGSPRIDELKKKFDENPGRYFAPLANEYRKAGQIDQAIEICRMYLAEKPGHMSGLIVFGQALFEATQLEEARTTFEQALALDPENLIALRHLGDIARQIGDPVAAKTWYQRVLDADPRNEEIAAALAEVSAEAAAAAPVEPASSGMSGWGDINPETSEAAAASTLLIQPTPPPTPSSSMEAAPPAPAASTPQADSRGQSVQIPRISLDMSAIESAPPAEPPPASPPPAATESKTLEFVPPAVQDTKRPSMGISSLGIEQAQEFESPLSSSGAASGGDIEFDRPFEASPEPASTGGAPLGLETTEFRPPSEPVRSGRDSIAGFQVDEPPAWERQRDEPEAAPPAPATSFVTETMAELYLKQGYRAEAINVYRQLVEQNPGDVALRDKLRGLESPAESRAETPAPAVKPPTPPARRSGGRNVRSFFGSLGARKAPARAADAYNSTFEKPEEPGPAEAGVTGPSDWIMEPSPAPSPAAEAQSSAPSPAPAAPDAFGASSNAWPEPPAGAAPTPSESGGWGIAPVTPPAPSRTPSPRFGSPVVSSAPPAAPERPATPPRAATPAPQQAAVQPPPAAASTSHSEAPRRPEPEASASASGSGSLDSLFSGASVKPQDADAAMMLAGAFGPPQTPSPTPPQQYPGQPARAAANELSLDNVFRDTPRKSGAVRTTGGFSFDQFFSDDAAGREKSDDADSASPRAPGGSREPTGAEEAQFSSWLEGLKKK